MSAIVLDVLIVLVLIGYARGGYVRGFVVTGLSLVGFVIGAVAGMVLVPTIVDQVTAVADSSLWRAVSVTLGILLCAVLGQSALGAIGARVRPKGRQSSVTTVDALLGFVASFVVAAVFLWLIATAVRPAVPAPLARGIASSRVLQVIDALVPSGGDRAFGALRDYLDSEGFPRVFDGLAPETILPIDEPEAASVQALRETETLASVVRVAGSAPDCDRRQGGSGVVIAPERVVTNAHVVAGVDEPTVQVGGRGDRVAARVVIFDPKRDLAVLAVPGLGAPSVDRGASLGRGDAAVVAGFPLGGPLRLEPARVRSTLVARGNDIYGNPGVSREVYSLRATVRQGNSGGPLLTPRGDLVGIIFAKSLDDDETGYALTLDEAQPVLDAAAGAVASVSTGTCAG